MATIVSPAELSHVAIQVPGTELVVVSDDGPLEQRERVLHGLSRCPVSFLQLLAMIALGEILFSDEALVGRTSVGEDLFGVLCQPGVQHWFNGFESAAGHGLGWILPSRSANPITMVLAALATFEPLWRRWPPIYVSSISTVVPLSPN